MEHACGFDRSQLQSDEGPPIGAMGAEPLTLVAFRLKTSLLRWN
jgi:hypothetical protein